MDKQHHDGEGSSFQELFPTRHEFNKEQVFLLSNDQEFLKEIESTRIRFQIPPKPTKDWLENERVQAESEGLLFQYGLPFYFRDWLRHLIVYGKPLPRVEITPEEYLIGFVRSPSEIVRVPLTTKEKALVSKYFKKVYGKHVPEVWNIYSKLLSQSKNNRRRSPQIYSADSIEKTLKQPVIFKKRVSDTTSAKKKKTYLDATAEVYPDEDGTNDTKIAQRLRKQVERSKKRKADMGNLKNSVTNLLNSSLE